VPIGITDCLNFGSPETDLGAWQLERAIDGIADACRALDLPVVSGNVSLYNETADGPILPTPVVGTVGLVEDRAAAPRLGWDAGDELWLLGAPAADADALAGSELAWRRGHRGGRPVVDPEPVAPLVRLLPTLGGTITAAHDASVGGIGVALARMAIASGIGAAVHLPTDGSPTAALFGERVGRCIVSVRASEVDGLRSRLREAGVEGASIGGARGDRLEILCGDSSLEVPVADLASAWRTPFAG
jgi:phosphoribosylformylglycinamidine synthase subunit PurL